MELVGWSRWRLAAGGQRQVVVGGSITTRRNKVQATILKVYVLSEEICSI